MRPPGRNGGPVRAATSRSENTGGAWYPNVLLLIFFAALNAALMLAMAVWAVLTENVAAEYVIVGAVVGFLFGFITAVLGPGRPLRAPRRVSDRRCCCRVPAAAAKRRWASSSAASGTASTADADYPDTP